MNGHNIFLAAFWAGLASLLLVILSLSVDARRREDEW